MSDISTHSRRVTARRLLAAATAASAAFALAACSDGSDGSTKVAAVIKGLDNPFFQAMEQGIEETANADEVSATVQAAASVDDTAGQSDKLAALAGQSFDCFIVNPITGNNLVQALAPVSSAGTPIVNIDRPIDTDAAAAAGIDITTYIGTDNVAAGGKAGGFVSANVPQGAKVAIIGGTAGDVTSADRVDGFKEAVGGSVQIVQEEAADWRREAALTKATNIIAAHPDIAAFFAANDDMGLGIVKAVENAGKTGQIVVVSVDGNDDALAAVRDGGLTATVAQYPYAIGSLGVQACKAAVAGQTLPKHVESPTALVTAQNADQALAAFPQPFEQFDNPLEDLGK